MENTNKQIIHELSLGSFKLYERTRLEEYEIEISAQQNITEYPGLLAISKAPEIKSGLFSADDIDWDILVFKTIELTLFQLIINGFVELVSFNDIKSYVNGLYKQEYENYRLAVKKSYSGKDYLSGHIVQSIKDIEEKEGKKADLQKVIHYLFDGHLGNTQSYPQRKLAESILLPYHTKYDWLNLERRPRLLGMYKQLEIIIAPKKRAELAADFKTLSNILITLKKESKAFSLYSDKLYDIVNSDLNERIPNSD